MKDICNQELDLLDELVNEGFSRLGLSDIQAPAEGEKLNKAGWLVNLKLRILTERDKRYADGRYPLFGKRPAEELGGFLAMCGEIEQIIRRSR